MSDYDEEVKKIKLRNEPLISEFRSHLENEGLSVKTIKSHIDNIDFFQDYLVYYEPLQSLYEVNSGEVSGFLDDFFPRKALWACPTNVKSYIATFKKLFKWMVLLDHIPKDEYSNLLELIKEEKKDWINAVAYEEDDCYW